MYAVYIWMKCIVKNTTIQFCVWRWCCHIQTIVTKVRFWSASSITSTYGLGVSVCEWEAALFPGISLLHPYVSRNSGLPWQRLPLHSGMGEVDLSHLLKRARLFTTGQFPGTPGSRRGWWGADARRCLKTWLTGFTCAHQDGVVCVCAPMTYTQLYYRETVANTLLMCRRWADWMSSPVTAFTVFTAVLSHKNSNGMVNGELMQMR